MTRRRGADRPARRRAPGPRRALGGGPIRDGGVWLAVFAQHHAGGDYPAAVMVTEDPASMLRSTAAARPRTMRVGLEAVSRMPDDALPVLTTLPRERILFRPGYSDDFQRPVGLRLSEADWAAVAGCLERFAYVLEYAW